MTYLDVEKVIRDENGQEVMRFADVVVRTSPAWDQLQTSDAWVTDAIGYANGWTVEYRTVR